MSTNFPISLDFYVEVNIQGFYSGTLRISSQRIDLGEERIKKESFLRRTKLSKIVLTEFLHMNCCVKSKELTLMYSWRIQAVAVVI